MPCLSRVSQCSLGLRPCRGLQLLLSRLGGLQLCSGVSSSICSAVVIFCSGLVCFCPVCSSLVVFCSTQMVYCSVCSSLVVFCPALVVFCPICSSLVVFCSARWSTAPSAPAWCSSVLLWWSSVPRRWSSAPSAPYVMNPVHGLPSACHQSRAARL